MALGAHAAQLLKDECTHYARGDTLPAFDEEGLKKVCTEINQLQKAIHDNLSNPFLGLNANEPYCAANIVTLTSAMLRNKRCTAAYIKMRQERLIKEWWRYGLDLPSETRERLSKPELTFVQGFDKVVTDYIADLEVDLRTGHWPPLMASHKRIISTKAVGDVPAEDGHDWSIDDSGEMFSVARSTADPLIQKGVAKSLK